MHEYKSTSNEKTLHKLKSLLLSEDKKRITLLEEELFELRSQIKDKEALINTLSPIITDLIHNKVINSREELAEALAPVMGSAIKHQINIAKDDIIDALYPVIGKTIRKSIAEAMKNLAYAVNEKIERTLSFHLFVNRFKSWVSGIPKEQLLLKNSLPFIIHEIFYIHKKTGILLGHKSCTNEESSAKEDVISGMLTAIQEFAKTAFSTEETMNIEEIEYDERQILIENGRHAYLAFVVSGVYPDGFKTTVHDMENDLHKKYASELRDFKGNIKPFEDVTDTLNYFTNRFAFVKYEQETKTERAHFPYALILVLLLIVILTSSYFLFFQKEPDSAILSVTDTKQSIITTPDELKSLLSEINEQVGDRIISDINKIKLVVDKNMLILEGRVSNSTDRLLIASAIAQIKPYSIILNNLVVDSIKIKSNINAIKSIENRKIYFGSNSSVLQEEAKLSIEDISQILKSISFNKLYITAHSDSVGMLDTKINICEKRAETVKNYLMKNGINEKSLAIVIKADSLPDAPNNTYRGRELNRRVAFKVVE